MGFVYSQARSVIIWLGPAHDGDESGEAMELLKYIRDRIEFDWETEELLPCGRCEEQDQH